MCMTYTGHLCFFLAVLGGVGGVAARSAETQPFRPDCI